MKKTYEKPLLEVVEIEIEDAVLQYSPFGSDYDNPTDIYNGVTM